MDATAPVEADLKLVREEDQYHQEQIERMMGIPGISLEVNYIRNSDTDLRWNK